MSPRPANDHADRVFQELRADVDSRLRRVCGEMSSEAFSALVDDISERKVRWSQRARSSLDD